jgi:hypothetical protein
MSWYVSTLYKNLKLEFVLGLDPNRFRTSSGPNERTFSALDTQISDAERFRDATPFRVRCRHCQGQLAFSISETEVRQCCRGTGSTLIVSPRRHLFYLSQGQRVLFAQKQSARAAYKPNWRFRYENILRSITKVGQYAMTRHATTRPE